MTFFTRDLTEYVNSRMQSLFQGDDGQNSSVACINWANISRKRINMLSLRG